MRPSRRLSIVVDVVDAPTVVVVVVVVVVVNNPASSASSIKTVFPDPVGALHTNDVSVCVNINSNISLCIALNALSFRAERVFNPRIFLSVLSSPKKKRPNKNHARKRTRENEKGKKGEKREEEKAGFARSTSRTETRTRSETVLRRGGAPPSLCLLAT